MGTEMGEDMIKLDMSFPRRYILPGVPLRSQKDNGINGKIHCVPNSTSSTFSLFVNAPGLFFLPGLSAQKPPKDSPIF